MGKGKILYSAIILTKESQEKLARLFSEFIPKDWEVFAHHMTFAFKQPLPDELKNKENEEVSIEVNGFGKTDKVMAVRVSGEYTQYTVNETPHITLAVNKNDGGTPAMSNDIEKWDDIEPPIELYGVIKEVTT